MSVFQTHLSAIILHSTLEPTIELMNEIIKTTKPNREQANRLRNAVGQTVQEHRRQSEEPIPPAGQREESLFQNIDLPEAVVNIVWEDPPPSKEATLSPSTHSTKAMGSLPGEPADGKDHGKIVSSSPFLATVHSSHVSGGFVYTSKTSNERIWEDGYFDFECMVCGAAYTTPKGVGSHRQFHVRNGEAVGLIQRDVINEAKRRPTKEERAWVEERDRIVQERGGAPMLNTHKAKVQPPPKPPVPDVIAANAKVRVIEDVPAPILEAHDEPDEFVVDQKEIDIITQIRALVMPGVEYQITMLEAEVETLTVERDKLRSDLQALKDLIGGLGA
jgi:hypothetical protein